MNKFNLEEMQQAVDSRSLTELSKPMSNESRREELKRESLNDRLWQRLQEIYGHQLNSQYGEIMPESWELLLKDLAPLQIKQGLESLVSRKETWPPNAVEFRQLCLPSTISPDGTNSAAYVMHKPAKQLTDQTKIKKIEKANTQAMTDIYGMFK